MFDPERTWVCLSIDLHISTCTYRRKKWRHKTLFIQQTTQKSSSLLTRYTCIEHKSSGHCTPMTSYSAFTMSRVCHILVNQRTPRPLCQYWWRRQYVLHWYVTM